MSAWPTAPSSADALSVAAIERGLLPNWRRERLAGLVQRNLTQRFGRLRAAVVTSVRFSILHMPINLAADGTLRESLVAIGVTTTFPR